MGSIADSDYDLVNSGSGLSDGGHSNRDDDDDVGIIDAKHAATLDEIDAEVTAELDGVDDDFNLGDLSAELAGLDDDEDDGDDLGGGGGSDGGGEEDDGDLDAELEAEIARELGE